MSAKKIGLTAAAALATLGIVVGGASLANAESSTSTSGTTSSVASSAGSAPSGAPSGAASTDTAVTGDELAKVTAAMTAKDSSVTVTEVRKDPDGTYDVLGTKDGSPVFYDVSADLTTFTANTMQAPSGTTGQAPSGTTGRAPTGQPPTGTTTPSAAAA